MLTSPWIETKKQPQGKNSKMFKFMEIDNVLINNEWVNNEIKEEVKKYLETNENEHTTTQNLCMGQSKGSLRGKFIAT